jgi:Zn-ribbon protein, possibly nucleic acid-binding
VNQPDSLSRRQGPRSARDCHALKELQAEFTRAENDVDLFERRFAQDQERSDHTSSAKDAFGYEHELATFRERLSVLEDVRLEVMARVEEAEKTLAPSSAATGKPEAELETARSEAAGFRPELGPDQTEWQGQGTELVNSLPGDLVELYERQRERYGFGASLLRARISEASGVTLTESDVQTIRQAPADEVVICPDSNAILVRTDESGL